MNREQLRAARMVNYQQVRNSWILWRSMTPQQQNMTIAGQQYDGQDIPAVNNYLDGLVAIVNTMQLHASPTTEAVTDIENDSLRWLASALSFGSICKLFWFKLVEVFHKY